MKEEISLTAQSGLYKYQRDKVEKNNEELTKRIEELEEENKLLKQLLKMFL